MREAIIAIVIFGLLFGIVMINEWYLAKRIEHLEDMEKIRQRDACAARAALEKERPS